ncbi:hypothetical protein H112_07539 [Trichophyton rubrum D6]|uniref:DUF803 domain-containing protein n=3 Tax=Trichophyton rubrum TaxID=5551 RepID=F2SE11_TRIRC|nr:uncharacterized protein TERG_00141 [Trichophyton rubrum CBS 118892]EZF11348.1 hypothetical protein H100_07565 [Trichophyton rubrum MR850]EZF38172.1 hypothetical protein H102_07528 [Trichophyton rubrum CBS 100081]EZF48847.1 hypothetical protein H103_07552 [Trichophyton rubrum CBS 288.86]EZF59517.1 hypothetical protein H104_07499 [Trichophyton rubrum CBS 289.86]EZF80875.1 hypothetical protein H110_07545 [Trichophyton rubrum MR1448]EZF91531.1 hypothetical protein H113_07605 [Trichophyton rubr
MGIFEMGLGHLSPTGGIIIGVLVGVISTSLQAVGLTLQRKSHILEDEKFPYDTRRPAFKRRRWQIGMFMFVSANIVGSTIQITTLPLPVLSTLQASGLVFNTIFATLILGEPFTRYSVIGTCLVCAGAILIATFGAIGEPAHTLDQLLKLLVRPAFLHWMAGTGVVVLLLVLGARALKVSPTPAQARGYMSIWSPHLHHSPRIKLVRGMIYGSLSGILSAHCLLLAKSAVELVVRTISDQDNQFVFWQSWIILLALVALALTQMYYMHRGLKLCSTSVLYPYVFCVYNIIAILDGLIYFHQASQLSGLHAGLIALGTVILLSGVLCLSWRLEESPTHPGQAAVPPPTSAIGPGLGLMEEPDTSAATYADFTHPGDEESYLGERQPLLHHTPRLRQPSSPFNHPYRASTFSHRRSTNPGLETAEILAELRDDQNDGDLGGRRELLARSALLPQDSPSWPRRASKRQRRKSTTSVSTGHRRLFSLWGTSSETTVPTGNDRDGRKLTDPKRANFAEGS